MASIPALGPGRKGAVRQRFQFVNPKTGISAKRDAKTGRIMGNTISGGSFKGVRSEK